MVNIYSINLIRPRRCAGWTEPMLSANALIFYPCRCSVSIIVISNSMLNSRISHVLLFLIKWRKILFLFVHSSLQPLYTLIYLHAYLTLTLPSTKDVWQWLTMKCLISDNGKTETKLMTLRKQLCSPVWLHTGWIGLPS